jgi:hypothetical protein
MSIQRKIEATVTKISKRQDSIPKAETIIAAQGGWRVSQVSIGYLITEAQVGKTITIAFGFTNLTETDATFKFPSNRRIVLKAMNSGGETVYSSPAGTGSSGTQVIKAAKGVYWTEKINLAADKFPAGSYFLMGETDSDLKCQASITLVVVA